MSDISYGQLVVISGINLDNDVISASQKAIAFASSNGMLATQPITGLSAETFNFNNDLAVGGDINLSSFDSSGNKVLILDSSKNITLSNITSTKLDYLDDVTSSIQSQLNTKAPSNAPTFTGGTTFSGTNTFTNTSTFTGPVNINNTLYANNSTTINADFYIKNGSTEKFKVTKTSGNVLTQGTLGVIGATTLSSSLTLGANLYSSGSYLNLEVTATDGYFRFRSNSTDIVRILANGSVGIGTITPSEKLHLKSDTDNEDVYIQLQSTGTEKTGIKMVGSTANIWYMQHDDANNTLGIGMDSNEFITINSSGNTSLLGNISLTGNLDISNQTFTVDSTTGNTRILGSLDVSGITTIGGKLNAPEIFYIDPAAIGDNTGTVIIMGNLQVDGSMTTINSTVVDISDRILVLASNSNGGLESNNAGIDVSGGGSIKYYTTNNTWKIDSNTDISGNTAIAGTLSVSGETVVDNSLIILGNIGVNTNAPTSALDISSTDALRIPVGTSSERPNVQKTGQVRYNTTTSQFEGYNNTSSWQGLGGVVDIDQDTKITAESNPLDDNDEIQIYTNGEERMRVDASGNVQLIKSDNRYVALDISATSAVLLPKGTTSQRPISGNTRMRSDISGAIRFNTDTSLCEIYTASEIWSGIPTYKTEQPPRLLYINKTALSETVTVNWSKFNEVYKDVFDGKSFPIYLQTFVDISFTDISGENSSGWKTIYIGNGNYNTSGSETTPLTEVSFNSVEQTTAQNTTGYSLSFLEKPSTVNLPIFNQDDLFDIRVYGVNNSGKSPNYIYINGVGLKQTGEPGPVTISNIDSYLKTSFEMDLSFNLDNNDSSVTSGISITHYDISFNINGTKSLVTRNHSENLFKHWSGSTSLSKTDISLNGLFPGAQYEIQVRAKNALKFNAGGASDGPAPTHLYKYGSFGPIVTSGFTNDGTNKYIDTSDLNSVSSSGLGLSLYGSANINCHIDGANNRTNRTIMNSNSYINLTGGSTFYVNYGKQGIDMNSNNDGLATANVNVKNKNGANSATLNYKRLGLASADTITFDSFEFSSPSAYTDEGDVSYNEGFVYSSSITCSTGHANNSLFNNDFTATTNEYYINYTIATTSNNNNGIISTGQTNVTNTTGSFYVDNYNSTPSVTFGSAPALVVTSSTRLFGIPSVTQIQATAEFTVSNFANTIIPYSGGRHSRVESITKNSFSFDNLDETNVYDNNNYTKTYTKTSNVSSGRYDATSSNNFTISVFYLNNTNVSTVDTHTHTQTLPNIGKIFRDTENTYSGNNLHFFNSSNTITGQITTNDSNFISTYASHISNILLYFNEKFVSGGFAATYDGVSISPFTDWSSGYAVSGADYSSYSSTGSGGYKWIAIDVTNKKSGNTIDLSTFKINGSSPVLAKFSDTTDVDGYETYISHDGKFGALNSVSNSGATLWFNDSTNSNISDAKSINGALKNNGVDAFIDSTTSTTIYLIVGLVQDANSYFTFS